MGILLLQQTALVQIGIVQTVTSRDTNRYSGPFADARPCELRVRDIYGG